MSITIAILFDLTFIYFSRVSKTAKIDLWQHQEAGRREIEMGGRVEKRDREEGDSGFPRSTMQLPTAVLLSMAGSRHIIWGVGWMKGGGSGEIRLWRVEGTGHVISHRATGLE